MATIILLTADRAVIGSADVAPDSVYYDGPHVYFRVRIGWAERSGKLATWEIWSHGKRMHECAFTTDGEPRVGFAVVNTLDVREGAVITMDFRSVCESPEEALRLATVLLGKAASWSWADETQSAPLPEGNEAR